MNENDFINVIVLMHKAATDSQNSHVDDARRAIVKTATLVSEPADRVAFLLLTAPGLVDIAIAGNNIFEALDIVEQIAPMLPARIREDYIEQDASKVLHAAHNAGCSSLVDSAMKLRGYAIA